MAYQPIEDYGIIGNMRSVALVGKKGSIDWFCFPHFDSPGLFSRILDENKGGFFEICPQNGDFNSKQFYWPETNVLITRFSVNEGIVEVTDYMPVGEDIKNDKDYRIVRRVRGIHGNVKMKMECRPGFNFSRDNHSVEVTKEGSIFRSKDLDMGLASTTPLKKKDGSACAFFNIHEEENFVFVLHKVEKNNNCLSFNEKQAEDRFLRTLSFWRNWLAKSQYTGRWREMVNRSALILKLLTFEPTGAIVAAPTCSLPEVIGGGRNWDYRYTWIRDAAFTIYAFLRIGFTEEASRFMDWIVDRCNEDPDTGDLQIMYSIEGKSKLKEEILDHYEGYRQSGPVRTGNAAYSQLQMDIYGELMDSAYLFNKYGQPISYETWKALSQSADYVVNNYHLKDEGIWEVRSDRKHFVYSKLMSWVALDRAIRLAQKRSFPADLDYWIKTRDKIYREIISRGWSSKRNAFVQFYESETLDASTLIMPLVFFMSPTDPMMLNTIKEIMKSPTKGGLVTNSLVYRYNNMESSDGLTDIEGTFNMCTFWLVEALTRAGRTHPELLDEARLIFEQMLGYSNHVGLYSEEIGLRGEALGNTPQAFTHLSLISAAYNLDKALNKAHFA